MHYVDDLLLCSPSLRIGKADTSALLNFLSSQGYRVSPSKVQLSIPQVTYFGLTSTPTHKAITLNRKNLIQSPTVPSTIEEIFVIPRKASFYVSGFLPFPSFLALYMKQC